MKGKYLDSIHDGNGRVLHASGWTDNTIVDSAWPVVAGLLKNDAAMAGILYWAVGAGDSSWEGTAQTPGPAVARLHHEVARLPVPAEAIVYLNPDGTPSAEPTGCIEISMVFTWPEAQQLREFGLFGGAASETPDSGRLINYVIHPRIDLLAGNSLTRRVRFTFKPQVGGSTPQEVFDHWLGNEPARHVDGVGRAYAQTLEQAGLLTVRDLAEMEPASLQPHIPLMRAVELRAKARLALRTVAILQTPATMAEYTPWDILTTPAQTLSTDTGVSQALVTRIIEQAGTLQLALDNAYLKGLTLSRLAVPL